jgi:hypothetical protein
MLTDYTSPDTVRALLGINDLEVEDAQLALEVYNLVVESGLDALSVTVLPLYETVKAVPEASRTPTQKRYYSSVQMYSATLVALELLPSLPMAVPRKIGDEKAITERVNDPFKLLSENLAASLAVLGTRIKATLTILDPGFVSTAVVRRFASVVGLSPDPVIGA